MACFANQRGLTRLLRIDTLLFARNLNPISPGQNEAVPCKLHTQIRRQRNGIAFIGIHWLTITRVFLLIDKNPIT